MPAWRQVTAAAVGIGLLAVSVPTIARATEGVASQTHASILAAPSAGESFRDRFRDALADNVGVSRSELDKAIRDSVGSGNQAQSSSREARVAAFLERLADELETSENDLIADIRDALSSSISGDKSSILNRFDSFAAKVKAV
jgi:hypothetical protein